MPKKNIKIKARNLKSLSQKSIGLINKKAQPVFFKTRFGIHTFGMKYKIDIVILDNDFNVVKIKKSLAPQKLFFWNAMHDKVLELPEGTVDALKIDLNTNLLLDLS